MDNELTMEDQILAYVCSHSGGVKFVELIAELTAVACENGETISDSFADEIEAEIRKSSKMRILEFTHTDLNRAKMFVYTP